MPNRTKKVASFFTVPGGSIFMSKLEANSPVKMNDDNL